MIRDKNLDRKRLIKVIPWTAFLGSQVAGSSTAVLDGFGTGAPVVTEVSSFGYGSFAMDEGDMLAVADQDTLAQVDLTEEIGVRVRWLEGATPQATDEILWIVLYDLADPGEAVIEPATALDTTIAMHTPGGTTALIYRRTSRGIINANTFDETAKLGLLGWRIEAEDMNGYSATEPRFLGLEIDYVPHIYQNPGLSENFNTHTSQSAA